MSINGAGKKNRLKLLLIVSAFVLTAATALVLSQCYIPESNTSVWEFSLDNVQGIEGFLLQFGLEVEKEENVREITLPAKSDVLFSEYADFQKSMGLELIKFSGEKVEERYLRLKNKTKQGRKLYAVLLICKEKIIAGHLTTLEQGSENMPLNAFV